MRLPIYMMLIMVCSANLTNNREAAMLITQGFMLGLYGAGGVDIEHVQQCYGLSTGVINNVVNAFFLLQSREPTQVAEAIRILQMAIQMYPNARISCQRSRDELQDFVNTFSYALNTLTYKQAVKNYQNNQDKLVPQINSAYINAVKKEWYDLGYGMGGITYTITTG